MSKIIIHNKTVLTDGEVCQVVSRFVDKYSKGGGEYIDNIIMRVFGKMFHIETGVNEKSNRIVVSDSSHLEIPICTPTSDRRHKFGFDKSQTKMELEQ